MTLNRALTRLLNRGLASGMCPLCHVAHKLDREYMWHFFDSYSDSGEAIDELRAAGGFCAAHAERLRAIEVEGLSSTLGIATVYLETLEGLAGERLDARRDLPDRAPCPACAYREAELARQAGYLHVLLDDDARARDSFAAGPGLCVAHLRLAWNHAESSEHRRRLAETQSAALAELLENLRVHIHDSSDGRRPDEHGLAAWQRAIYATAGWPEA